MSNTRKILTGIAGLAATVAAATPAVAQSGRNPIGQIINQVVGYGQYPYGNYGYGQQSYRSSQIAIDQCARATEARLNNMSMNNRYNRWNPNQNPYGNWAVRGQARVLGIDGVQVRNNGRLKVTGVATSGRRYDRGYGYGTYNYNRSYGTPDLRFSCRAGRSGQVFDVDIERMSYYSRGRR
ncbi:MAG: hypothetical protein ABIS38_03100 [Sphingomicrobium sp.]